MINIRHLSTTVYMPDVSLSSKPNRGKTCAHLLIWKWWPLAFFSIPSRSSSFFLREATVCSFLSSPVFFACAKPSYKVHVIFVTTVAQHISNRMALIVCNIAFECPGNPAASSCARPLPAAACRPSTSLHTLVLLLTQLTSSMKSSAADCPKQKYCLAIHC